MRWLAVPCALLAACGFEAPAVIPSGSVDAAPSVPCAALPDFDGDGRGDACDSCPHLAGAEADADGDGVGDACDPNPQRATESRAIWETFDAPLTGWEMVGTWTFDGGEARHDGLDNELDYLSHPLVLPRAYAATRVRVEAFRTDGDELPSLGVSTGGIAPKTQYYSCAAGRFPVVGQRLYAASQWGDGEQLESTDWPDSFATVELVQWVSDDRSHCYGKDGVADLGLSTDRGVSEGRVSLFSIEARGVFEYLFVVRVDA